MGEAISIPPGPQVHHSLITSRGATLHPLSGRKRYSCTQKLMFARGQLLLESDAVSKAAKSQSIPRNTSRRSRPLIDLAKFEFCQTPAQAGTSPRAMSKLELCPSAASRHVTVLC